MNNRPKNWWILILILAAGLAGCSTQTKGLQRPNSIAVAADGTLFVSDFGNHRVVHITGTGDYLGAFGKFGSKPEQLYDGWDIALDAAGNIYICNTVSDDERTRHEGIKVFSPNGKFLREIDGMEYPTGSELEARIPYGLDVDRMGRVYIAYFNLGALRVFDADGELIGEFFGPESDPSFPGLNDVAVDDSRGLLYAVDFNAAVVQQFRLESSSENQLQLTHLRTIGKYGRGPGEFAYPQNITVDERTGLVYVGDMANRRIQVFDQQGNYVMEFSPPDVSDWQVTGLAVSADGTLYAVDQLNYAIWAFTTEGRMLRRIEVTR